MKHKGIISNTHLFFDRRLSSKENSTAQFYILYTALFIAIFLIAFCWYFMVGKTFIWNVDGWMQHYKAMIYYARYMRAGLKALLLEHRISFPEWDFALGEGNDVLQSMHYYVIGDPFALPCVLIPTRYMWLFYGFATAFRMYCSGLTFSWLCLYMNKNCSRFALMSGTISYVFCYWSVLNISRHPFFINPMVFFPLVILGVEKIIRKEKPYVFIIGVFCSAVSNFYMFYIIVLLTVVYLLVRATLLYKHRFKEIVPLFLRVALWAGLGAVMAAAILMPMCYNFLNDARMEGGTKFHLLYPLDYYTVLPSILLSGNTSYWLCMGYSVSVVLCIFLLFNKKSKHTALKILYIISAVIIIIPAFGQILNGASYMSNRWCWALALLCCYTSVLMWPELMKLTKRDAVKLCAVLCLFFAICVICEKGRITSAFSAIVIALFFVILLLCFNADSKQMRLKQFTALALVIISIANMCFFSNAPSTDYLTNDTVDSSDITQNLKANETKLIKKAASKNGDDFYRYSGRGLTLNAGTVAGISSTNYYWSISNAQLAEFANEMELLETLPQRRVAYDDRAPLLSLSSVKYYTILDGEEDTPVPYGFEYIDTLDANRDVTKKAKKEMANEYGVKKLRRKQRKKLEKVTARKYGLYRNTMALPLTYSYNNAIGDSVWNSLSSPQKQEAMLQAVYLTGYDGAEASPVFDTESVDYKIKCKGTDISMEGNRLIVTGRDAAVKLTFKGLPKSETYCILHNLQFQGLSEYDLYFGTDMYTPQFPYGKTYWNLLPKTQHERIMRNRLSWTNPFEATIIMDASSGWTKNINYFTENYPWYTGRHNYTVSFGYSDEAVTSITIHFSENGIYTFDSLELMCQPMEKYSAEIAALKEDTLKNTVVKNDRVSGDITLNSEKYLCFSIPYSEGWTAYVDGEESNIHMANVRHMALQLKPGKHRIELIYHTPLLRYGVIASALGWLVFLTLVITGIIKKRKQKQ